MTRNATIFVAAALVALGARSTLARAGDLPTAPLATQPLATDTLGKPRNLRRLVAPCKAAYCRPVSAEEDEKQQTVPLEVDAAVQHVTARAHGIIAREEGRAESVRDDALQSAEDHVVQTVRETVIELNHPVVVEHHDHGSGSSVEVNVGVCPEGTKTCIVIVEDVVATTGP